MATTTQTIRVNLTRQEVLARLAKLPTTLNSQAGAGGLMRVLKVRIGLAALRFIHHAFKVKSAHGTDPAGLRWSPLSPVTVMMRAKKDTIKSARENVAKLRRERRRWQQVFKTALGLLGDEDHARRMAWLVVKNEGQDTTLNKYRGFSAKILDETGKLQRSLEPGAPPFAAAFSPPKVERQVFRLEKKAVVVGTRRQYALDHHEGRPAKKPPLPQRRLWAQPSQWPGVWWQQLLKQAREGAVDIIQHVLRR